MWLSNTSGHMGGSIFGIGKSQAKRYDEIPAAARVTFANVAGIDEAREELVEVVDFLKSPDKYARLGGTMPKGVLLVGAPGTGKTLLARATAGEAGVRFFSMGASEFVEMIVGVGASRVRDLFKQAREAAPSIVFIDELDASGRARPRGDSEGPHTRSAACWRCGPERGCGGHSGSGGCGPAESGQRSSPAGRAPPGKPGDPSRLRRRAREAGAGASRRRSSNTRLWTNRTVAGRCSALGPTSNKPSPSS